MTLRTWSIKLGIGFAIIGVLVFVGMLYNSLMLRHYRNQVGTPGKRYLVEGLPMHLYCTGQGSPTLVLSAGLGDDFTIWRTVQPVLSRHTRVCAYDRPGFGWSAPRSERQDAEAVARELHELIAAASVEKPFVLVGHSISGLYVREYAERYRDELAGLVFIDGSAPEQDLRMPANFERLQAQSRRYMPLEKLLVASGLARLLGYCADASADVGVYKAWVEADTCVPAQIDAMENEWDAASISEQETLHTGPFGNLPVLILSRDPRWQAPSLPPYLASLNARVWNQLQEQSKELSSQSRRIIALGSGHYIQRDRPDLVNHEIWLFISMLRAHQTFANNHGTISE